MDHTIAPGMPAKKPPQTAFGKRMVALRQARGLTQIELAKAAETTQRAISYYETEAEFPNRLRPHPSGSRTPGDDG